MKISALKVSALDIPFRTSFRHASAVRDRTQSIWVEAASYDGICGYGEGCPREYVTSESLGGARAALGGMSEDVRRSVDGIGALRNWVVAHAEKVDRNPAAWTAAECAILDLIGRTSDRSVESILGLSELAGVFRYTAVIGDAQPEAFVAQLGQYRNGGFSAFKIKLSGNPVRDGAKVKALVDAGIPPESVRADANNLWSDAETAIRDLKALEYPFWAIEEPLRPGDYPGMLRVAQALGARIILDESLLRVSQISELGNLQKQCVTNLRVSKMGGILRSLKLLQVLRSFDIPVIVGAHVGESSLLTRAGMTMACAAGDLLLGQEGAFGIHLLQRDVVEPPLMFGSGGVLNVGSASLGQAGWGLNIIHQCSDGNT